MKVFLLGNQARAMSNFWTVFIRRLIAHGHEVVCAVPHPHPDDDPVWEATLQKLGARLVWYHLDRKGLNPLRDLTTLRDITALLNTEKPDRLFAYTIKPVIYGALAAMFAKVPPKADRYLMVTGLGYMFEGDTFVKKVLMQIARWLYYLAFSCVGTVFFQNDDDRTLFEKLSIIPSRTAVAMTRGTGVDLDHFSLQPYTAGNPRFLFVGRLIEAKGLGEYCEAAALLKVQHPDFEFAVLGPVESGAGAYSLKRLRQWEEKGVIRYLGETKDVRPYLAGAGVVVLPSWREGTPCSLMEAMSTGRAVVAADAPGSREVVQDGVNGYLVPVRNPQALAQALERLATTPGLMEHMGAEGRKCMEDGFSAEQVAAQIMATMRLS